MVNVPAIEKLLVITGAVKWEILIFENSSVPAALVIFQGIPVVSIKVTVPVPALNEPLLSAKKPATEIGYEFAVRLPPAKVIFPLTAREPPFNVKVPELIVSAAIVTAVVILGWLAVSPIIAVSFEAGQNPLQDVQFPTLAQAESTLPVHEQFAGEVSVYEA